MPEPQVWQVFVGGKTKRSNPRILSESKNIKGQRNAIAKAKAYHEEHPSVYVGVYGLKRVRIYKPKKASK